MGNPQYMTSSMSLYASEAKRFAVLARSIDEQPTQSLTNGTHVGSRGRTARKLWRP